jgi:hypothetical protein
MWLHLVQFYGEQSKCQTNLFSQVLKSDLLTNTCRAGSLCIGVSVIVSTQYSHQSGLGSILFAQYFKRSEAMSVKTLNEMNLNSYKEKQSTRGINREQIEGYLIL